MIYIIIIFACILLEGFFSGVEIAVVSLNRIRLRILAEAKDKKAVRIQKMLSNPDRLLGTTLVGTNLAVVVASSVCTKLIYDRYGFNSEWVTTLILAPIVLVFGEFVPKAIFSQRADRITYHLGFILKFFWKLFYPLVWLINRFVNLILKWLMDPAAAKKGSPFVTREELRYLIRESEAEGEIGPYERSIIYKIFDFGKKKAKDIMKPLEEMVYLSGFNDIEELLVKAEQSGYSRFPIRSESGQFQGLVNILDVVYEEDKKKLLQEFIRPLEYVDANMDIDNILFNLQSEKQTFAIVRDPHHTSIGFFTMKDLLEELVGEI